MAAAEDNRKNDFGQSHDDHPPHVPFESLPAWGSVYGLASCVAIIVVSKRIGKAWLMRRENYYDS